MNVILYKTFKVTFSTFYLLKFAKDVFTGKEGTFGTSAT